MTPPLQLANYGPYMFLQEMELYWVLRDDLAEHAVAMVTVAVRLKEVVA
jgi:hypothetical protein